MAFNSLVSGADCGPINPLASLVKQAESDRSLQRDRVGPSGSGSTLRHLPSSAISGPSASDTALARQFFEGPSGSSTPLPQATPFQIPRGFTHSGSPSPFGSATPLQRHATHPSLSEAWDRGLQKDFNSGNLEDAWNIGAKPHPSATVPESMIQRMPPPTMGTMQPYGGGYVPMNPMMMGQMPMYSMNTARTTTALPQTQADWEEQFSRVAAADSKGKGKAQDVEADQSSNELADAFKNVSLAHEKDLDELDYMKEMQEIWEKLKKEMGEESSHDQADLAKWEAEYQQVLRAQREEDEDLQNFDYTGDTMRAWESFSSDLGAEYGLGNTNDSVDSAKINPDGTPILGNYPFEPNNPQLITPTGELLAKAKQYLADNGSLSEAALMIEAAIQKGELGEGGYEAWILLGETRSMDEREDIGLIALQEGVRLAKAAGVIGPGMISLAVSYTNEGYDIAAHATLREWLRAKYPSAKVQEPEPNHRSPWHSHDLTTEAFLGVARELHAKGESDPDVQVGLGILHYADSEYDKAKDCFESALWARPNDYLLWNRLGSCLSNGSKPEEALGVYREALRLRPTYTRAIYNVGVACLNIGAHKEAAEHFLSALAIQKTASSSNTPQTPQSSEQLWKTLRKTLHAMGRDDLTDLTQKGDVELFRSHGFDF
ncbi:Peroxisomal membrane signal receptor PTS1 [Tulasnella sp. 418]|nr:Peroxisomal membrane signal receptor PTS1 [Tulasnella sp. 418]